MSTTFSEIGRRLREIRKATGLTQAEFAEFLGTSYRSYKAYETGKREVTTALILKVEEKCRVAQGWLLSGDNPELDDSKLQIIEHTLQRGFTALKEKGLEIDPPKWSGKFRLAIKLGLNQSRSLSVTDIAEILEIPNKREKDYPHENN
ncbi:helix-turn-helix domain-containing protein [Planktotalea arctica]|uniref:helix-turn-helix domain-containing protein n=1 Tax=Planktotalea arctica TaxID=1481893 RepID=UPI00321ABF06